MKKIKLLWMAMLTLMLPALQSCDDNDGYSLGDIAVDWATVRVVGGDTYSLNADRWGTLWPAATAIPFYKPIDGQRVITYFNPLSVRIYRLRRSILSVWFVICGLQLLRERMMDTSIWNFAIIHTMM